MTLKVGETYKTVGGYFVDIVYFDEGNRYPYFGHVYYLDEAYYEPEKEIMPIGFSWDNKTSNRTERAFDIDCVTSEERFYKPYLPKEVEFIAEKSYYYHLKPEFMTGYVEMVQNILKKKRSSYWSDVLAYISNPNSKKGKLNEWP